MEHNHLIHTTMYNVMYVYVLAGAYEPLKVAKEHETQFHDNPNYVTTFENS